MNGIILNLSLNLKALAQAEDAWSSVETREELVNQLKACWKRTLKASQPESGWQEVQKKHGCTGHMPRFHPAHLASHPD